jgi:SAM-dependent methyltransferase
VLSEAALNAGYPGAPQATWLSVTHCPACASGNVAERIQLAGREYVFGREMFGYPAEGIALLRCGDCDLVYKALVPDHEFLSGVFTRQAGEKWMEPYGFASDAQQLIGLTGNRDFDVLDIGAGSGTLLNACRERGINGRRSALDVIPHPGVFGHISGEFIRGFLDDERLGWSGQPYDVVTLFDVLEHLYRPQVAFRNLRHLVRRDGVIVIETGNVASYWPRRFGLGQWWYARLFEHHLFWCRKSMERIAAAHGLRISSWRECRHKLRRGLHALSVTRDLVKVGCYRVSPTLYGQLAARLGKVGAQPWSPVARDHVRVVLRVQEGMAA